MKNDGYSEIHRVAVILAGGSGQRLWPLSREHMPKQLIPVFEGKSLLEAAYERVEEVIPLEHRWVCAGASWEAMIREKIPSLSKFIGEPTGRDTLAAIALSCAHAYAADRDAIVAFLTSDHVIRPVSAFAKALSRAFELIERDASLLATFGVFPSFPATAYGYLELGEDVGSGASRVKRFKEKPDKATAERYCAEGPKAYLWNSGMFVWSAKRFLELLARYEPDVAEAVARIGSAIETPQYEELLAEIYPTIKKKSVDYGIMEPASVDPDVRVCCVPLELEWMDIGSWNAYSALASRDEKGNAAILANGSAREAAAIFLESQNTVAISTDPQHLIACFGCEDLIVVHTKDATLVCPKSKAEELKALYPSVKDRGWA